MTDRPWNEQQEQVDWLERDQYEPDNDPILPDDIYDPAEWQ